MIKAWRRRSLQNLSRLRLLATIIALRLMEVLLHVAAEALISHLVLRSTSLALIIMFPLLQLGNGSLLLRLRHAHEQLFGARWFRGRTSALHQPHEELRIAVDSRVLLHTTTALTRSLVTLSNKFLEHLLRAS